MNSRRNENYFLQNQLTSLDDKYLKQKISLWDNSKVDTPEEKFFELAAILLKSI